MSRDEHLRSQPAKASTEYEAEPGGWEERQQQRAERDRRNDGPEQLRKGSEHPLHHGRTVHGEHAIDGDDDSETDTKEQIVRRPL